MPKPQHQPAGVLFIVFKTTCLRVMFFIAVGGEGLTKKNITLTTVKHNANYGTVEKNITLTTVKHNANYGTVEKT
jgi:hypothetical protein